jgi:hypothetical protein
MRRRREGLRASQTATNCTETEITPDSKNPATVQQVANEGDVSGGRGALRGWRVLGTASAAITPPIVCELHYPDRAGQLTISTR